VPLNIPVWASGPGLSFAPVIKGESGFRTSVPFLNLLTASCLVNHKMSDHLVALGGKQREPLEHAVVCGLEKAQVQPERLHAGCMHSGRTAG
jgi:hypothetical protein